MSLLRLLSLSLVVCSTVAACDPVSLGVIGGAATVGTAAAEERGLSASASDLRIKAQVTDLWLRSDRDLFSRLTVTVREGRVQITGAVKKPEDQIEAIRLAWQIDGVKQVLDEIQVEDQSGFVDYTRDVRIAQAMRNRLLVDREIRNINYTVDVVNATIYLMGIAQNSTELDRVLAHARDISGVRRVVNHVILRDDPRRSPKN